MKRIVLLLLFLLPGYCFAQMQLSFNTGIAAFDMVQMRSHQRELQADFPVAARVVEAFPAFWFFEGSFTGKVSNRVRVGILLGYTSTGGRIHYKDYSGEMACNQTTTATILGFRGLVKLNNSEKFSLNFSWKSGVELGRYKLDLLLTTNTTKDTDELRFRSHNFFLEPGLALTKPIIGKLSANVSAGYSYDILPGKLKLVDSDAYLEDQSGRPITLNWSGVRVGAGLVVGM